MSTLCTHLDQIQVLATEETTCPQCVAEGDGWVHLRLCLTCGQVGCCDSSPNQHASKHAASSGHPIVGSLEPGEVWQWCFIDKAIV
jgi:uncharacterized UBP type Zn finger protein